MTFRWKGRNLAALAAVVAVIVAIVLIAGAVTRRKNQPAEVSVETVELRDIAVTIEATGAVEPIDLVEVKSKASGQILQMPVSVGSVVKAGELLAQIDVVDVRNQHEQSQAADAAARANLEVAESQKMRSDELFKQQVITASEHESATLGLANAQSQAVKARTDLDVARQRLADATVRAPIAGTILAQDVAVGQVISSATSSVSGGTTLLKMADLGRIRMRALVTETDIGRVTPGQTASVTVEAFPDKPFEGTVEKIEPQAVVQQSVTMFPVLISITNEQSLLLPGMNGEVSMIVDRRSDVPAVPLDAVRSMRELSIVAAALGLDAGSVQEQLAAQRQSVAQRAETGAGWAGRAAGADSSGRGHRGGGMRPGGRDGQRSGAPGAGDQRSSRGMAAAPTGAAAATAPTGATGMEGSSSSSQQIAFVKTSSGLEPRLVRLRDQRLRLRASAERTSRGRAGRPARRGGASGEEAGNAEHDPRADGQRHPRQPGHDDPARHGHERRHGGPLAWNSERP